MTFCCYIFKGVSSNIILIKILKKVTKKEFIMKSVDLIIN